MGFGTWDLGEGGLGGCAEGSLKVSRMPGASRPNVRRLFLLALANLAAGVVLTLLLTWSIALTSSIQKVDISYDPPQSPRLSSGSSVPADWQFGCRVIGTGPATRYELVTELVWVGSTLGAMSGRLNRSVERVEVGWPFATMEWIGDMDYRMPPRVGGGAGRGAAAIGSSEWIWRAGIEPPFRKRHLYQGAARRLPLVPLWPGFAANTVILAAGCWLAVAGTRAVRRSVRRRRGLCTACGYPRGSSAVCSECGASQIVGRQELKTSGGKPASRESDLSPLR